MLNLFKILYLGILIFFTSCKKEKQNDIIEIYLTKERIESYDGVPIEKAYKDSVIQKRLLNRYGNKIRIDTINKRIIFAGKFNFSDKDLQKKPFIKNSEIIRIDFKNSGISFKESVAEKIYDSIITWRNENHRYGRQFVLKHNNENVLSGYLFSIMSSKLSNTYQILYYPLNEKSKNDTIDKITYSLYEGLNWDNNLQNNKLLKKAFEKRTLNK